MKKAIFIIIVAISPLVLLAQANKYEYTPKVKKQVAIVNLLGEISLKNTTGNAIVVESDFNMDKPERAEGLKLLGAMEDNTNLGINVSEENGVVTISGISKKVRDYSYTISIPQGIAVNIDYSSPFAGSDVEVESYKGSLEIKTLSADVKLNDCTGPLTINSISGDVEAVFSSLNQNEPSSLASVSGLIDISLPAESKATVEISNITGSVYNNLDLQSVKPEKEDKRAEGLASVKRNNGNNSYTLNGGGTKMFLKSVSGNIYLRKK